LLAVLLSRSCLPLEIPPCCLIRKSNAVEYIGCDKSEITGMPPFHGDNVARARVCTRVKRTCKHRLNAGATDKTCGLKTTGLLANTLSIVSCYGES